MLGGWKNRVDNVIFEAWEMFKEFPDTKPIYHILGLDFGFKDPNVLVETLTFTNASATGNTGPTQSQINSAYSGTTLDGKVTVNTQGIQEWTVPYTMTYTIEAWGPEGGGTDAGKGARMKGDFNFKIFI